MNPVPGVIRRTPVAGGEPILLPTCFHCGLPASESHWFALIDGLREPMCCPGCKAVAETIVASGFTDYYRTRSGFAATGRQQPVPARLRLYDAAGLQQDGDDAETVEAIFSVEDIRCAACVWLIERQIARLPGIKRADMNVATQRLHVAWQSGACKPSDILQALGEIGYLAYPYDAIRHSGQLERARKTLFRQLFVAGLSMMQVMMYALPVYLATDGTMDDDMTSLKRWAGLLLTLPTVAYSARPFFKGAWLSLKHRLPGMDVPVAIGIAAAFGASVVATLQRHGDVYFDSVTMFIFLLLCSRYLELLARRKAASALDNLQHAMPASAWRMTGYPAARATELVGAGELKAADIVLVKPGEPVPVDGVIIEGSTAVDLSLLTGESALQHCTVGATLPGGAINATQTVVMRATHPVCDSTLSTLVKLIDRAGQGKPALAAWADKVAAWFVVALMLFAVAVFFAWQWLDPARAWPVAIAVLVVSCPCALSLATPTALAAATNRLVKQGILIVKPHVLETMHRATHIVFDKTGTLTVGKPVLRHIAPLNGEHVDACLQIAAALEAASAHPLSSAFAHAVHERNLTVPVAAEVLHINGQGLEGTVNRLHYRLGSAAFVQVLAGQPIAEEPIAEVTSVYLGIAGAWLARFDLADALRDDAQEAVRYFQASGRQVMLLSGDRQAIAQRVADALGIELVIGDCLPEQKLACVHDLQRSGAIIAMIGDGINDAAVLRAADVSFAMGSGSALAQMNADCVLWSGRLSSLVDADRTAATTLSVIRQNLVWATLYNMAAIPAAALGWLNPWLAGIGMSVSSAIVVLNAMRLLRTREADPQAQRPAAAPLHAHS